MKKVLMIIGGIVLGLVVIGVIIFFIVSASSKKLVCESSAGNITIMYNDKSLTGYTTLGDITYDYDQQNEYAKSVGIDNYIAEFTTWFSTNTTGSCTKK